MRLRADYVTQSGRRSSAALSFLLRPVWLVRQKDTARGDHGLHGSGLAIESKAHLGIYDEVKGEDKNYESNLSAAMASVICSAAGSTLRDAYRPRLLGAGTSFAARAERAYRSGTRQLRPILPLHDH